MAAFSTENANLTWQRVKNALANSNPGIVSAFKALKSHLAQHKSNPNLQYLAFTDADVCGADGVVAATGVSKLYAVYVKKNGTSGTGTATDSFLKVYDDATDDSAAGDAVVALALLAANDERIFVDPVGVPLAAGAVITSHTTISGATDSTAGDSGNGFILVGD
jgi:hypothetical protein